MFERMVDLKRAFLVRLMTRLGFGGMAAYCIIACSAQNDVSKKPAEQVPEKAAPEVTAAPAAPAVQEGVAPTDAAAPAESEVAKPLPQDEPAAAEGVVPVVSDAPLAGDAAPQVVGDVKVAEPIHGADQLDQIGAAGQVPEVHTQSGQNTGKQTDKAKPAIIPDEPQNVFQQTNPPKRYGIRPKKPATKYGVWRDKRVDL